MLLTAVSWFIERQSASSWLLQVCLRMVLFWVPDPVRTQSCCFSSKTVCHFCSWTGRGIICPLLWLAQVLCWSWCACSSKCAFFRRQSRWCCLQWQVKDWCVCLCKAAELSLYGSWCQWKFLTEYEVTLLVNFPKFSSFAILKHDYALFFSNSDYWDSKSYSRFLFAVESEAKAKTKVRFEEIFRRHAGLADTKKSKKKKFDFQESIVVSWNTCRLCLVTFLNRKKIRQTYCRKKM